MVCSRLRHLVLALVAPCALLSACAGIPPDTFRVPEGATKIRSMETRRFEGGDRKQIYTAAAGVLQDLGFTLTETQSDLGLLVGSKDRSAYSVGQIAGTILMRYVTLGLGGTSVDKNQRFFAAVVVTDVLNQSGKAVPGQYAVRATFSRKVWNTDEKLTTAEQLRDQELYQGFFDKLSKAVFLEAQSI